MRRTLAYLAAAFAAVSAGLYGAYATRVPSDITKMGLAAVAVLALVAAAATGLAALLARR